MTLDDFGSLCANLSQGADPGREIYGRDWIELWIMPSGRCVEQRLITVMPHESRRRPEFTKRYA